MYLKNKDLYYEIVVSKAQGRLTKNAENMLILLGNKTIKKMRYDNNDLKLDCLQDGLLDMFTSWLSFNEEKSENSFAYFTEIFKRGITRGFNSITKHKGDDEKNIKTISINSSNNGNGLHNI